MADTLISVFPLILVFFVMWFFLIRPQQRSQQKRKEMLENIRRGDNIVTTGGIVGKITKIVNSSEIELEIANTVVVKVLRSCILEVRSKTEPVVTKE